MFKVTILSLIIISAAAVSLTAHPHLFIEPSLGVIVEDNTITGLRVSWKWDMWWSMDVIAEADKNRDGFLDKEEVKIVYDKFFVGIKDFDFFTEIRVNGKKQDTDDIKDFNAVIEKDKIVSYSFVFPLNEELQEQTGFLVRFSDPTIFVAFDRKIELLNKDSVNYREKRTSNHGYYGVQIEFQVAK